MKAMKVYLPASKLFIHTLIFSSDFAKKHCRVFGDVQQMTKDASYKWLVKTADGEDSSALASNICTLEGLRAFLLKARRYPRQRVYRGRYARQEGA